MNKIRKITALFFALSVMITAMCVFPAAANAPETTGLDIVAVLDASGSMRQNGNIPANADVGKKYLVPGMETLIKITSEQKYPVNMGVVIFSLPHNTVTVGDGLWELTDGETPNSANVDALTKDVIADYQYKSHTDQPNGVAKAIELLEGGSDNNKKLILLITDGVNDDGSDPNKVNSAEIDAKQPGVISLAKEKGIAISTIGFNPYAEDFSKLDEYAKETNGYSVQLVSPEDISDEIIKSVLGNTWGSDTVSAGSSQFDKKINIPEMVDNKTVVVFNMIFETPDIKNLTVTSPNGKIIAADDPSGALSVSYTSKNTIANLTVGGDYGEWSLSGEKPADEEINVTYIVTAIVPTVIADEPTVTTPAPLPETVAETASQTTAAPPETVSETAPPETVTVPAPEIPKEVFVIGGIVIAAAAVITVLVFAIRAGKPPKLKGELLISYKSDGLNSRPDSVEFDRTKTRQTLFEMFAHSAEDIVENTAAENAAVIKFFKKVTFDATRSGAIKFANPYGVSTLTVNDNGYEFTAKFPVAGKSDTVTVTFFVNYYNTVKED
jgi:hypothetical protein